MVITPIRCTIGYDDVKKLWHLKASREEVNGPNDVAPWKELLEDAVNLGQIIIFLLDWWASAGSTVNATMGSMSALAANIAGRDLQFIENAIATPVGSPGEPGPDFAAPPYNGVADNWGVPVH